MPRRGLTAHHLIPRACHANKWFRKRFTREVMQRTVALCRDCHREIHRTIPSEKELGRHYHSLEALCAHPDLGRYVEWARGRR